MFVRPKPGESEEDILAQQEAYLAEKEKNKEFVPSAKVVNLRKHKTDQPAQTAPKQSKYAESKELKKRSKVTFDDNPTLLGEAANIECNISENEKVSEDDKVYFPSVIHSVLGDIVEKNVGTVQPKTQHKSLFAAGGFPTPKKRDKNITTSNSRSIFSQQMKFKVKMEVDDPIPSNVSSSEDIKMETSSSLVDRSIIIQGEDAAAIHNENQAMLERMTEQEIMEEKEKLTAILDPGLVEYIKSLRKKNKTKPILDVKPIPPMQSNLTVERDALNNLSDNDIITHPNLQNWIHFDTLERDKLQWIQNMESVNNNKDIDKPYEARFDFKGYLLPYTIEYTEETKTLFHHGEDPHRPGYSLNELFQLSRSTVTQQRALALHSIAGILEYHSLGIYKDVIDIPITKTFFVLRFALDENISIILEPTLKALRNMFYNRVDEACLDFLLGSENGLLQPRLLSKKFENEDTDSDVSELKDFHLVDLDLVSGAIRTDILTRIRYILNTVKPTLTCVEFALEILTRLSRDSPENAETLFNTEGLMECIFFNFLPEFISTTTTSKVDTDHHKLILNALKLVRILVSQSKKIADQCYSQYKITERLLNYIGNTVAENILVLKIQIESLYLWASLLTYGIGLNELTDLKCVLLKVLDNHVRGTDITVSFPVIMHSHAAAVINLLTNARLAAAHVFISLNFDLLSDFHHLVITGAQKWTSQISTLKSFTGGHLKSISALFIYLNVTLQLDYEKICSSVDVLNACVHKMIKSEGFLKVTSNVIDCSNLLSVTKVSKHHKESNLPHLGSSVISGSHNLLPTLTASSPISFISSLSKYIYTSKNKEIALDFVQHKNIFNYIKRISCSEQLSLSDNWFTKIELDVLSNCICFLAHLEFSDTEKEILYNFSFKLTYILSPEYRSQLEFILKHIIFNKTWFTTDRLLRNLNISETENLLNHLDNIFQCYASVLKLNCNNETSSLTVSNWDQKVLPRDWMFLPILGLYTKSQDPEDSKIPKCLLKTKEELVKNIVICSLEWILVSELYFPEITNEIGLTDRFCRLSCVFLCDNSLFLDETVRPLLSKCMKIIFDIENDSFSQNKLNFDQSLLGINNFQDLYTQLVDQFQAVSYGDPTFSACVLVPLAQRHNIKWKKLVWSEYAACLRALDCPEESLCYKLEEYFLPEELDFSLLKCYHRALVSNLVRPGTIAFKIAQKHVEFAQNRQKSSKMSTNN